MSEPMSMQNHVVTNDSPAALPLDAEHPVPDTAAPDPTQAPRDTVWTRLHQLRTRVPQLALLAATWIGTEFPHDILGGGSKGHG